MSKINLIGTNNTRDFCGIVNQEGKEIVSKKYIRSEALNHLTILDQRKLVKDYHLKTVIDLRTHLELVKSPDRMIPGVHYEHVSILEKGLEGISHEKEMLNHLPNMNDLYRYMVRDEFCVSQFKRVIQMILSQEGTVLWHCTAGKDRCGLTSAFFLSILGVSQEEIMKDYLLTNEAKSMKPVAYYAGALALTHDKEKANQIQQVMAAHPSYLKSAWDEIDQLYGNMDSFLENQLGVTPIQKENLKQRVFK